MYRSRRELSKAKVCVLILACVCALASVTGGAGKILETSAKPQAVRQIILDAGHGGADGGATGVHEEVEKDINLAITKDLQKLFLLSGFEVIMTRDEDVSIHDKSSKTMAEQKKSDIRNRLKLMEEHPDALVISIHQNHYEEASSHGAQMFYGKKNAVSEVLAGYLQEAFVADLQEGNTRQIKEGPHSVYLLEQATVPIVLVECGFLSNPEEAELLTQEEYQEKVAFTVYHGVCQYIQESSK